MKNKTKQNDNKKEQSNWTTLQVVLMGYLNCPKTKQKK